jgi:hypothetical protein
MQKRRLEALHPQFNGLYDPVAVQWKGTGPFGETGWTSPAGAVATLFHETQIDLSGYNLQRMTLFPQAIGIQDPGIYSLKPGAGSASNGMMVIDVITSVPLDVLQVSNDSPSGVFPGMIGSQYEYSQVLFGMARFFAVNTTVPFPDYQQLQRSQRFGSGEPNASDKLYCYRIIRILAENLDAASTILIPASRQVIAATIDEEPELVYMQRLKRSYELADQL